MSFLQIILLGIIQGLAELLPVSSSAHVIVAEKLMHLDPSGPQAMFVLAMLHTGTMFAVLGYFWKSWKEHYFSSQEKFVAVFKKAFLASAITAVLGFGLVKVIEKTVLHGGDVEELARNLQLLATCLAIAGIFIIITGLKRAEPTPEGATRSRRPDLTLEGSAWMGFSQALVLPFRGLSRSGVTISTGLLTGASRRDCEEFSFVLAVIITPAVIVREFLRLHKAYPLALERGEMGQLVAPGLIGLVASFLAGLVALRLLSSWLEQGRWRYFGYYCLGAAVVAAILAVAGF